MSGKRKNWCQNEVDEETTVGFENVPRHFKGSQLKLADEEDWNIQERALREERLIIVGMVRSLL